MTENTKIYSIKDVNNKIKEYYEQIKLSWKNQDDFILDNFIKEIEEIFSKIPSNDISSDNTTYFQPYQYNNSIKVLKENILDIEKDLKKYTESFNSKDEIFLNFDFFSEIKWLKTILNEEELKWYLWVYYIIAIKWLLVLWKNEINLLDESMSFHHISKSKLDIKKINDILIEINEDINNIESWKKIIEEILNYSDFLLFKLNNKDLEVKYNCYLDLINFNNLCNICENSKWNISEDEKIKIENLLKKFITDVRFNTIYKSITIENDIELYLIFRYIKDVKYIDDNLKAYNYLKSILGNYLEWKTEFYKNWNIAFFINNLISLLNKSIENDNKNANFLYDSEIDYIDNLFDKNNLIQTYFTYYKKAQLYKNLWKLKESNNLFKEASNYIDESIKLFEKNDWAYFPFSASSDLIKSDWIFSYSTFITPTKTDYYLKIKKEQLSISEYKSEYRINQKEKDIDDKILKNQIDIDDKFHNSNIKTIEILAVFSAIVLFVSSTVQVFQYLPNVSSIIYVIVWFWFSLILFISLIFFIIGNEKNYYKYWYIYWILFLMIILFIVTSLNIKNDNVLINKEYQDKTKDEIIKDLKNNIELNNSYIDLINSKYNSIESKNKE